MAREHSFVLPSGVEIKVRALKGKDQETITQQDKIGEIGQFNQMLADCIVSLGNKTNISKNDVSRMLVNDRKYALVQLRQFSLKYKDTFDFDYEWPLEEGRKVVSKHSVVFTDDYFPAEPYKWVRDVIEEIEKGDDEEKKMSLEKMKNSGIMFPVMYSEYSEMLATNKVQKFKTEDGDEIEWECANGEEEEAWSKAAKSAININVQLKMRKPKVLLRDAEKNVVRANWSLSEADINDVEAFRKITKETEGNIDTYLTIEHPSKESKRERIDLVGTTDFFFPSQAI